MNRRAINKFTVLSALSLFAICDQASALTVDWSGYFRADHNFVQNYQMDKGAPGYSGPPSPTDSDAGRDGEYIRGQGSKRATWSTVFMKLKPKVLVNDNIIVRSEWNIGDPLTGMFGRNIPTVDRSNTFSTGKDPMSISVARLWLDTHTDFGTLQIGRAPMHWGLGVIFNSGDSPFDRFQSTSDTIRLISKFGYLSLMPLYAKNSMGRSLGGASNPTNDIVIQGSDDITDYGLALKYENPEEDLEAGGIFYKRNASDSQTSYYLPTSASTYTAGSNGMNLKLIDFYVKKSWNHLELGAEVPIFSGEIGNVANYVNPGAGGSNRNTYEATAIAIEAALKYDTWRHSLKLGTVPGQGPMTTGNHTNKFSAMYLHRNYKLGQILFGYNLGNFGGANPDSVGASTATQTYVTPYDAAVTNAKYLMFSSEKKWEQWSLVGGFIFGKANQTAQAGQDAWNHRTKQWLTAKSSQGNNLGMEFDLGTHYSWDDNIAFGVDVGMFLPGNYFKFINQVNREGAADTVTAGSFTVSTVF